LLVAGAVALMTGCDPRVVIGTRWGEPGDASSGGTGTGEPPSGTPAGGDAAGGGGTVGSDAGAGGAPEAPRWCAVAPWLNERVAFSGERGTLVPAGSYRLSYESGAQIHDQSLGYEVTDHYWGKGSLEAGHHVFSGDSPAAGGTSLWLVDDGLIGGDSIDDVENANRGYAWPPLTHVGGELYITLYDDYFGDNSGPGVKLCITPTE
jgi:hypothetical protein